MTRRTAPRWRPSRPRALSPNQERALALSYWRGEATYTQLAAAYGIVPSTVGAIVRRHRPTTKEQP